MPAMWKGNTFRVRHAMHLCKKIGAVSFAHYAIDKNSDRKKFIAFNAQNHGVCKTQWKKECAV